MKYLPSTKFLLLVGAFGIVGGMIFFATGGSGLFKSTVFDRGTQDNGGVVAVSDSGVSSGNWQDTLGKIGAPQYESSGRAGTSSAKKKSTGSQSMTETLTQGIIAKVPQLQVQGGGTLDPQTTQNMVNSILKDVPEGTTAVVHASSELSVFETANPADLKTYGNALADIFISYANKFRATGSELEIVNTAVQTNDASGLKKLPAIETLYKSMVQELIAMKVPKDVAPIHLNITNAYEVIISSLYDLGSVISDPVKGLSGITHYKLGSQTIQANLVNLNNLFNLRGVTFGSGDAGVIFSNAKAQ